MLAEINNLTIETVGTEEDTEEQLTASLEMDVEEDRGGEDDNEGGGTQRSLGALEFLTQEAEPSGSTLVDDRNGFNELSRLAILWTVRHC